MILPGQVVQVTQTHIRGRHAKHETPPSGYELLPKMTWLFSDTARGGCFALSGWPTRRRAKPRPS